MTKYLKAIYAALLAGLGAAATAYLNGHQHIGVLGGIGIATAAVTALGVVWAVPNAPPS